MLIIRAALALFVVIGLLAVPLDGQGQPATRLPTVGVLVTTVFTDDLRQAIREGLREHGYVESQNIAIEWRAAEGRTDRASTLAAELVRLNVDVIAAIQTPAVQAAQRATRTIPIVMAGAGDPVRSGFIASLARPGGNITGVTGIPAELAGKHVGLLRQLLPGLSRLALLTYLADSFSISLTEQTQAAAKTSGIAVHVVSVRNVEELDRAFATMAEQRDEAVIVQPIFTSSAGRIAQLGLRYRLPTISTQKEFVEAGGLLAYGASQLDLARRGMFHVARVLRGAKAGDLPVEQPTNFHLLINLKTARALDLALPPSLLLQADQVRE